jgi:hypothetical protein
MFALNFSGSAGQIASVSEGFGASLWYSVYILGPSGAIVAQTPQPIFNGNYPFVGLTLTTGIYTVVFVPGGGASGNATISLTINTMNPTIAPNTPVTEAVNSPGQVVAYNFAGNAGQIVSLSAKMDSWFVVYLLPELCTSARAG